MFYLFVLFLVRVVCIAMIDLITTSDSYLLNLQCFVPTGGDQGLLNSFFSDWARGDISKHLPFLYNVTSAAFYSYLPALKQ